jgi:hypothetical protein
VKNKIKSRKLSQICFVEKWRNLAPQRKRKKKKRTGGYQTIRKKKNPTSYFVN